MSVSFLYEINSFSLTVSDHLAGSLSGSPVTNHISWLTACGPHCVPLWCWELMRVIGTIASRGLPCIWLVHWLQFSAALLSETVEHIPFSEALPYVPLCLVSDYLPLFCLVNVQWWRGTKTEQDEAVLYLPGLEFKIPELSRLFWPQSNLLLSAGFPLEFSGVQNYQKRLKQVEQNRCISNSTWIPQMI